MATVNAKPKKSKGTVKPRVPLSGPYGVVYEDRETASQTSNIVMRPGENNTYRLFSVSREKDGVKNAPKFVWASNWHEAVALCVVGRKPFHAETNPACEWHVGPADGRQRGQVAKLTVSDVTLVLKYLPSVIAGKNAEKIAKLMELRPATIPYLRSENRLEVPDDLKAEALLLDI